MILVYQKEASNSNSNVIKKIYKGVKTFVGIFQNKFEEKVLIIWYQKYFENMGIWTTAAFVILLIFGLSKMASNSKIGQPKNW